MRCYAPQLRGRHRKYRDHADEFTQITPHARGNASIGGLRRPFSAQHSISCTCTIQQTSHPLLGVAYGERFDQQELTRNGGTGFPPASERRAVAHKSKLKRYQPHRKSFKIGGWKRTTEERADFHCSRSTRSFPNSTKGWVMVMMVVLNRDTPDTSDTL